VDAEADAYRPARSGLSPLGAGTKEVTAKTAGTRPGFVCGIDGPSRMNCRALEILGALSVCVHRLPF
jgi:hypothetical protein